MTIFTVVWIRIFSISSIFIYYLESCCHVLWLLLFFTSIYIYRRGKIKMLMESQCIVYYILYVYYKCTYNCIWTFSNLKNNDDVKQNWFSLIWLSFAILSVLIVCDLKHMSIKTNMLKTWMHENAWHCRICFLHDILNFANLHTAYTFSNSSHYFTPITFAPIILLKTGVRFAMFSS